MHININAYLTALDKLQEKKVAVDKDSREIHPTGVVRISLSPSISILFQFPTQT